MSQDGEAEKGDAKRTSLDKKSNHIWLAPLVSYSPTETRTVQQQSPIHSGPSFIMYIYNPGVLQLLTLRALRRGSRLATVASHPLFLYPLRSHPIAPSTPPKKKVRRL